MSRRNTYESILARTNRLQSYGVNISFGHQDGGYRFETTDGRGTTWACGMTAAEASSFLDGVDACRGMVRRMPDASGIQKLWGI